MDFKFQNIIQFIYRVLYGQISLIITHNKVLVYYMSNCIKKQYKSSKFLAKKKLVQLLYYLSVH